MLRRFFDEGTEQGGRGTPYSREALAVLTASLRDVETGPFQKLLADGLTHAPSLAGADLQKTNLQGAYLSSRAGNPPLDLRAADFFRADLTDASLRSADAKGAVFFQARLTNTVFRNADLRGANFVDADLLGARFEGANVEGASFAGARNVPDHVVALLESLGDDLEASDLQSAPKRVFLSKPGAAQIDARRLVDALSDRIVEHGFELVHIDPRSYPVAGAVAEVRREMSACSGAVVVALPDLTVAEGHWRSATPQTRIVADESFPSPWTTTETGMAVGLGLPVLLAVASGVSDLTFDYSQQEPAMYRIDLATDHRSDAFRQAFDDWCGAVRQRS